MQTALTQQKHLFLEKPLCVTPEEHTQSILETAAEQACLPMILVGHNRRFSPHSPTPAVVTESSDSAGDPNAC